VFINPASQKVGNMSNLKFDAQSMFNKN